MLKKSIRSWSTIAMRRRSSQPDRPRKFRLNSGSSANLLAVELMDLSVGSEVITPLLTFSTTVAPLLQKGLIPVFEPFYKIETGFTFYNVHQPSN